jgi:hypothetical protein
VRNEIIISNKWAELVMQSRSAIENFNDFIDDKAVCWADDRINGLSLALSAILDSGEIPYCESSPLVSAAREELLKLNKGDAQR